MRIWSFEAWNTEDKTMSTAPRGIATILFHVLGVAQPTGFSNCDGTPKQSKFILREYTGINDKINEPLYEFDLVVFEFDNGERSLPYLVIFKNGSYWIARQHQSDLLYSCKDRIAKIGNAFKDIDTTDRELFEFFKNWLKSA